MFWFWRAELKSGNFTHENIMLIDMSFCVSYIRKKDKEHSNMFFPIYSARNRTQLWFFDVGEWYIVDFWYGFIKVWVLQKIVLNQISISTFLPLIRNLKIKFVTKTHTTYTCLFSSAVKIEVITPTLTLQL